MVKITFGRENYHRHGDMIDWCRNNIGQGGWGILKENDSRRWAVEINFGYTTFWFSNESDYLIFLLTNETN